MTKVDRSTYAGFSNKLSKGTPNQYWVERFIDKVRIHIYPTPDSTNASKDMHFYFIKRIQDVQEIIQMHLMYHLDLCLAWYQDLHII